MSDTLNTKIIEFINERLFTDVQAVQFQDLMSAFAVSHLQAKGFMYEYYKQTTGMKFNCVILCVFKDGDMKIVNDISSFDSLNQDIVDCFIYAFNPMKEYIPMSSISDHYKSLTIKNSVEYKGKIAEVNVASSVPKIVNRSHTADVSESKGTSTMSQRSKTIAADGKNEAKSVKLNSSTTKSKPGSSLRSTEILAKMKRAREEKEEERQNELKKRKDEQNKKMQNDPKRKKQLESLKGIFDDEDEDDVELASEAADASTQETHLKTEEEKKVPAKTEKDYENLEDLLDTTAEESLLGIKNPSSPKKVEALDEEENKEVPEEVSSSFVDEEGYIVTQRPAPKTKTPSKSKQKPKTLPSSANKDKIKQESALKTRTTGVKKQTTLEGFFKKSSKK
ncbi:hypothetical protein TPHA_0B04060 [Tetrapisispora phaffii CBS 4417]|uniref:DNA polymerase delta subunit 3 n=1 Tax=Tetrapisispora phaffii (strain ATCC 24235 / CBS 4417 / NBRC 1672 / NRRL Y-8282 / UCD 70-5) TaxID=1071381 RepID=G8BPZ7_TETPH|nr:hypothetical protein TPHA_0B04060 [Tetrapisispora phaffii CBS 4417]CCE62078.1 hypothetical protein TPHA_0B04060 [Tetrapisispora phaffii CBS 4417]